MSQHLTLTILCVTTVFPTFLHKKAVESENKQVMSVTIPVK